MRVFGISKGAKSLYSYESIRNDIFVLTPKVSGNLNIKNRDDKRNIRLNKQVFLSDDFKLLFCAPLKVLK